SFDRWGGFDSLKGFDNFYGIDNFDGSNFEQVFVKDRELTCKSHEVNVVQQRLLLLQEMAKRVIIEQACDVETQVILWEQFRAGLHGFERDIIRSPGKRHEFGFDQEIVGHFPKFINQDGSLNSDDWKFSGKDRGRHTVRVGGHNWDNSRSVKTVKDAWNAARNAYFSLHQRFF
ncbi:hypothetical protein BKA70DRAFT_1096632, partial [Coprinopsis sp. MPI-PUGE-AT-0042]